MTDATSFLLQSAAQNRGSTIPAGFFGMHLNNASPNGIFSQPQTPFHAEVGFKAIRLWDAFVTWRLVETASGVYNWSRLDFLVAQAQTAGVDIIYTFAAPPDWATTPNTGSGPSYNNYPPNNISDWTTFITAVVTRYGSQIKYYEIWNEPDISFNGTIAQLVTLATTAYSTIKAANPNAIVLSPPLSSAYISAWTWLSNYLQAAQASSLPHADVIGVHGYVQPSAPEFIIAHAHCVASIAQNVGLGSLPLWCTEFGYISYYDQTSGALITTQGTNMSPSQGAAYITRMMLSAWLGGFKRAYFYTFDSNNILNIAVINYPTDVNTLLRPALAYQYLAGLLSGGTLSNYKQSPNGYSADFSTPTKRTGTVYWCIDGQTTSISSNGFISATDNIGTAVTPSGGIYTITNSPIFAFRS